MPFWQRKRRQSDGARPFNRYSPQGLNARAYFHALSDGELVVLDESGTSDRTIRSSQCNGSAL